MSLREVQATGAEALNLATVLLQRARLADPLAGIWEAADFQWWWRVPRTSDDAEKVFWLDDQGPVAGIHGSSWANDTWQIDPVIVPGVTSISPEKVWQKALELGARYAPGGFDVPIRDDDSMFRGFARDSGLFAGDSDWTAWMDAADKPEISPLADRFTIVDRTQRVGEPHPMQDRNGEGIAERLAELSLYDPSLDLAVKSEDGRNAAYILFWFDPATSVGLIEPVRTHDAFQRMGIARALLTFGINRLVVKGAERLKVSWETEPAGALYHKVGFKQQSTSTWHHAELKQ